LQAPVSMMAQYLPMPSRAPAYRAGRPHQEFVASLEIKPGVLQQRLRAVWGADETVVDWPQAQSEALVRSKYALTEWNLKW